MAKKIPVYTSLYFLSQNSQPSFPRFVPGDSLSTLRGEGAVPSPVTLCHGAAVSRVSGRGETWSPPSDLGLRLPTAPENLKLLRCYICLFGSVSHESIVCHMLFFLVEADVM